VTHSDGGKGDKQRPTNKEAFDKHFDAIFGKKEQPKPQPTSPQHTTK
jgi:uncharacterized protein with von Willebrand factor type A (vWA) domain